MNRTDQEGRFKDSLDLMHADVCHTTWPKIKQLEAPHIFPVTLRQVVGAWTCASAAPSHWWLRRNSHHSQASPSYSPKTLSQTLFQGQILGFFFDGFQRFSIDVHRL